MADDNYPKYGDPNFSFIDDMKRRFGNAKDIMLEPTEEQPEGDYSMLPNQYMAGQGLGKVFRAYQALMPDPIRITPSEEQISKMNPHMQAMYKNMEPMYMDPMGFVGSIKFPKVGKAIGGLAGEASAAQNVAKEVGPMVKKYGAAVGNELPAEMSMMDRIKLAKERSGPIRQTETFEQAANAKDMERYKNMPKNYFDKARQTATNQMLEKNEERMQQILDNYKDDPEKFEALKRILGREE